MYNQDTTGQLVIAHGQLSRQLKLLGYKQGDTVYLRAFYHKDDPRKTSDKGKKAEAKSLDQLLNIVQNWQAEGRGVYFTVNGGGHKDIDVIQCRAIFYEHDNLDKELSKELWRSLSLPEPTFQVDTGGKSIHSYWVFDEPIDPTLWKELQTDLLVYADADRALKNPSRVMRLAGAYHISPSGFFPSVIIASSEIKYSFELLRRTVPPTKTTSQLIQTTTQAIGVTLEPKTTNLDNSISDKTTGTTLPSKWPTTPFEDVPLTECLKVQERDLIANGVGEGSRNTTGAALARNLIGTSLRLQYLNEPFSGDPKLLLDNYCARCSPPLDAREAEQIWKSALKDNPSATLTDDAIMNCVKSWKRRQQALNTTISISTRGQVNSSSNTQATGDNQSKPVEVSLKERITEILSRGSKPSEEKIALLTLSKQTSTSTKDIEAIVKALRQEQASADDKADLVAKLPTLVEAQKTRLNLANFLWGDGSVLAESMQSVAQAMPTAPEFLFTSFLPVAASRIGSSATIMIKPEANFKQPSIIRTCIVGKSGDMKSPAQAVVIEPLEELETEARERYKQEFADYEQELHYWERNGREGEKPLQPVCKRYILQNGSIESRIAIHAENPRGLLVYRDEWSAHLTGRNKYRQGKGDDTENELTEFNGGQLIKDVAEASKRLHLAKTAISRTGTTQFETLKKLMSDHQDSAGEFGRWLFCASPCPPAYLDLKSTGKQSVLGKLLKKVYRELETIPEQEYHLSADTKEYFEAYYNSLVDLGYSEQTLGIQVALPKMRSYFARFTLILHLVNQVLAGRVQTPESEIDTFTVVAAAELCDYFLAQLRLIYALNSPSEELSSRVLHLKTWLTAKASITLRDIKRTFRQYRNLSNADLNTDLQVLLDSGYITQTKSGKTIYYSTVATSEQVSPQLSAVWQNPEIDQNLDISGLEREHQTQLLALSPQLSAEEKPEPEPLAEAFSPQVSAISNFSSPLLDLQDKPASQVTDSQDESGDTSQNEPESTQTLTLQGSESADSCGDSCGEFLATSTFESADTSQKAADSADTSKQMPTIDSQNDQTAENSLTSNSHNSILKPLNFSLQAGDKIRCYPTDRHENNQWAVKATVVDVQAEQGWFLGCTIQYQDKNKRTRSVRIAGGCSDWILRKL